MQKNRERGEILCNSRATIYGVTFWRELTALYGLLCSYVGVERLRRHIGCSPRPIYKDEQWLGLMLYLAKLLWTSVHDRAFRFSGYTVVDDDSTPCRVHSHIRDSKRNKEYSYFLCFWKKMEKVWRYLTEAWIESTKYVEAFWKRS